MKTYRTAQLASLIGVHPNTIRFYEAEGLLPPVSRLANGYRQYTDRHLYHLRFLRLTLKAEILGADLRTEAIQIIKTAATGSYAAAAEQTTLYMAHLKQELDQAKDAITLVGQLTSGSCEAGSVTGRRNAAALLHVSADVLRDWERNGLINAPRTGRQKLYTAETMARLKIVSTLRGAGYSQMAIRRMLERLDGGMTDLLTAIDTPTPAEDIVSVADRYITSLTGALQDGAEMLRLLQKMKTLQ